MANLQLEDEWDFTNFRETRLQYLANIFDGMEIIGYLGVVDTLLVLPSVLR